MTCAAHGCHAPAGIKNGGGWICRYHFGREVQDWQYITGRVNALMPIVRLAEKVRADNTRHESAVMESLKAAIEGRVPELIPTENEARGWWLNRAEKYVERQLVSNKKELEAA